MDAFLAASNPSNDGAITGAPSAMLLVKTNPSVKATSALTDTNSDTYAKVTAKNAGVNGNLIYFSVTSNTAEVVPSVGPFTWIPPVGEVKYSVNSNGGAIIAGTILAAATIPSALVTSINALAGTPLAASGGADRVILSVAGTLATAHPSGNLIVITRSQVWQVNPVAGDTLSIPAGSVIAGAGNANVGAYVVTSATTTTVSATKLSDANLPGAVVGVITAPVVVAPAGIGATTDLRSYAPVTIAQTAGAVIDGYGKSFEFADATDASTDSFHANAYQLNTVPVTWVSTASVPVLVASSVELSVSLNTNRSLDGISEVLTAGGEVAMKVSYKGGSAATMTITQKQLTTTVTGGSGVNLTVLFSQFPTLNDIVSYINAQTGYSASLGTAVLGALPGSALDDTTSNILSINGAGTGRIKDDYYRMFNAVSQGSILVTLDPTGVVPEGLPLVNTTNVYMTGGALGATTNAIVTAALLACQAVTCNFVVPLFSQDATADIALAATDPTSTYTILAINAAAKSHALAMSTPKRRKARNALVSVRDSFVNDQNSSANLASYRTNCTFQDVKVQDSFGNITQQQPWMAAVLAASLQAAGFYKGITHKLVNCSGVVDSSGDFSDQNDTQVETALKAGLLPIRRSQTGGFYFVSDQTTYGKDNNFYYNSLQSIYVGDIVSLTTALKFENKFVGSSTADTTAAVALTFLDGVMADFRRLKLISPSSDAPAGFKNPSILINGPSMSVSCEVKLTGTIYFVPINFLISQVQSAAGTPSTTF